MQHAVERDWHTVADNAAAYIHLDFSAPPPLLATRVLCAGLQDAGGNPLAEDTIWQWTLACRLQALLQLAQALSNAPLELAVRCSHCQENLSLQCDLQQFIQPPAVEPIILESMGQPLHIRLPTGRDQQDWLEGSWNAERIAHSLLQDNGVPDNQPLDETLLDAMTTVLERADPLTTLVLDTTCPACATAQSIPLDLEQSLLTRIKSHVTRLLQKVHRLASHYHWTEDAILGLPRQRLEFYLSCIEKAAAR